MTFVVQDQLLYRIHEADAGHVTKQLMVPMTSGIEYCRWHTSQLCLGILE